MPRRLAPHVTCATGCTHCPAPYNRYSTLGHPRVPVADRLQTRLKVDAQLDQLTLMCATLTIRLSLTASAPHSNPPLCMPVGTLPTSLDPDGQLY